MISGLLHARGRVDRSAGFGFPSGSDHQYWMPRATIKLILLSIICVRFTFTANHDSVYLPILCFTGQFKDNFAHCRQRSES